ncbi:MAG: hypothetical protein BGO78_09080 [Chloroflexi bacterium 44-23]|nr:MAG: hypothetical protein BGO78_09080 [Chloroflexi bacterium 44-23]
MFAAQIFSTMPHDWSDGRMVAALAEFSEAYQKMFLDHAGHYNLYIIGDSQPVFEQGGQIYHVAHFF